MKSTTRPTLDDLSPDARRFWKQRGLLTTLPLGLLIELERALEQEEQGWREQIEREFATRSRKR